MVRRTSQKDTGGIALPSAVSIKDVLVLITAIVTVVSAWGVYGTRLALVEDKVLQQDKRIDEAKRDIADMRARVDQTDKTASGLDQRVGFLERQNNR